MRIYIAYLRAHLAADPPACKSDVYKVQNWPIFINAGLTVYL